MSQDYIYPVAGDESYRSAGIPIVRAFRLDIGAQAQGTDTTEIFKKGSLILGFRARVTEAVTSDGSATVQLGFSGTTMLSAATAKTSLDAIGDELGPDNSADAAPLLLTADDTFDSIVATADLTAGKLDVWVTYVPPEAPLSTDTHEYTTA